MILLSPGERRDIWKRMYGHKLEDGGSWYQVYGVNEASRDIAKAQAENILKWGNEICLEHGHKRGYARHECLKCWQALRKEIEG